DSSADVRIVFGDRDSDGRGVNGVSNEIDSTDCYGNGRTGCRVLKRETSTDRTRGRCPWRRSTAAGISDPVGVGDDHGTSVVLGEVWCITIGHPAWWVKSRPRQ